MPVPTKEVHKTEAELRALLQAAAFSREYFVLVAEERNSIMTDIERTYFPYGEGREFCVEVRVPCDRNILTKRGTKRLVRDHVLLVFSRKGCSAEALTKELYAYGGTTAINMMAGERKENQFEGIDAETLSTHPIVYAYDRTQWSMLGVLELVEHFRGWLRNGPVDT